MSRLRSALALAGVMIGGSLGGLAIWELGRLPFLRIDWEDPAGWTQRVPVEWIAAAGLRLVGLAAAIWLVGSTGLYVLARLLGLGAAITTVEWASLPAVRRWADRVVAGGLAMAGISGPISAAAADPIPVVLMIDQPSGQTVAPGYVPIPAGRPEAVPTTSTTLPPPPAPTKSSPSPVSPEPGHIEVVVKPGDNLWCLAEQRLEAAWGRPATDPEIAPYWVEVVEANRPRIRSGNPDLIFPGEVVVLPPAPAVR